MITKYHPNQNFRTFTMFRTVLIFKQQRLGRSVFRADNRLCHAIQCRSILSAQGLARPLMVARSIPKFTRFIPCCDTIYVGHCVLRNREPQQPGITSAL